MMYPDSQLASDEYIFMRNALAQAKLALALGEFPAGCVLVFNGKVVSSAHNSRFWTNSKIAHAELKLLHEQSSFLSLNRSQCDLYVTIEPCMMCLGAAIASRVRAIYFGAKDFGAGATSMISSSRHYKKFSPSIHPNVLASESLALLREYRSMTGQDWIEEYFFPIDGTG